jgi:hypothetical protein
LPQSSANPSVDELNEPIPDANFGCPEPGSPDSTMNTPAVQPTAVVVQPYAYVQTYPSGYYVKSYVRVPFLGIGFSFGRGHWVGGGYQGHDPYGRSYGGWSQPSYYRQGGSSYYGSGGNWYYRPGPIAGSYGGNAYAGASAGGGRSYFGGGGGYGRR